MALVIGILHCYMPLPPSIPIHNENVGGTKTTIIVGVHSVTIQPSISPAVTMLLSRIA